LLLHSSIFSNNGASTKSGAIQSARDRPPQQRSWRQRIDTPDQLPGRNIRLGYHHDLRHRDRLRPMLDLADTMLPKPQLQGSESDLPAVTRN
jgi:hypothetical protein